MKGLLFIAAGLIASSSYAVYTPSATLNISGTVLAINEIEITPTIDAIDLNITGGETNQLVATVSERSNSFTGYKITMKSANASKLVNSLAGGAFTNYTVLYDTMTVPMTLTTDDQEVKNVASLTALTTVSSDVKVNVTAKPLAPAGTYSDTITISIAAN